MGGSCSPRDGRRLFRYLAKRYERGGATLERGASIVSHEANMRWAKCVNPLGGKKGSRLK